MSDVVVAGAERAANASAPRAPGDASAARPSSSRSISRRGTLPTGRAVVGGVLVAVAALGVFVGGSRGAVPAFGFFVPDERATRGPTTQYVVARHDLPVGTRLTADDLT